MVQPSVAVPARAALQMALRSACSIQRYFVGRTSRSGTSSRMPRGKELYPHQPFGHIVADAAREGVVPGGADFVVGTDDHAADLGIRILAAGGDDLADIKV